MIAPTPNTYSADVRISLRIGDREFNVAQVGNGYCILRDPETVSPCNAELILSVDGVEKRRRIFLGDGIEPAMVRTPFLNVDFAADVTSGD